MSLQARSGAERAQHLLVGPDLLQHRQLDLRVLRWQEEMCMGKGEF